MEKFSLLEKNIKRKMIIFNEVVISCFVLLLSIFSFSLSLYAQKEANIWYFGIDDSVFTAPFCPTSVIRGGGLNFNSGIPIPLSYSAFSPNKGWAVEGNAVIADKNTGRLLFYTGPSVDTCVPIPENLLALWDSTHTLMQNGDSLLSSGSSVQSSIIIPVPSNDSLFYVFTTDCRERDFVYGLRYNIVNMNINSGKGGVVSGKKNILLKDTVSERLTAVKHCNGEDVWLIARDFGSNDFLSYLVTSSGINSPIISSVGYVDNIVSKAAGIMKASPNGKKLGMVFGNTGVELFDFDAYSGKVCNPITITGLSLPYGLSFSSDNSKLYFTEYVGAKIHQIDLHAGGGNPDSIIASDTIVGLAGFAAGMQLATDGKIYVSQVNSNNLAVINQPNNKGAACNFSNPGQPLAPGKICQQGLPNFIESYFLDASYIDTSSINALFSDSSSCAGDTVYFTDLSRYNIPCFVSWEWDFDDPASGVNNASSLQNPKHIFDKGGIYNVQLTIREQCNTDTFVLPVYVNSDTSYLVTNYNICPGDSIQIGWAFNSIHQWSPIDYLNDTSITNPYASPPSNTAYSLILNSTVCPDTLLFDIEVSPLVIASVNNDDTICQNSNRQLTASGGSSYLWIPANGLDNPFINNPLASPLTTTSYSVIVSDSVLCGIDTAYVTITINPIPVVTAIPIDTSILLGSSIQLSVSGALNYNWTPSTGLDCYSCDNPIATPSNNITYYVVGTNIYGCSNIDSVIIRFSSVIYVANAFSPNNDGYNDVFRIRGSGIKNIIFSIYDRWGKKMFETDDISEGWDGKYKNKIVNDGVYVYHMNINFMDGTNKVLKGNISLLR